MAQEGARERELHRYYQPWLEAFMSNENPVTSLSIPVPDHIHRPRSSQDKALTAFAQLGCLRLNAKRGVVTLVDSESQYILAEATKSVSLVHDSHHDPGDELWFGNSIVPRSQGVSADALYPTDYTATSADGSDSFTAPALVIADIAQHPIYGQRGYAGRGVSFYCGVPITTKAGHVIGVYNVTDNEPRQSLTPQELRFMTDMAVIVVQHLEIVKNDRARARGERMIRGIGTFIEGKTTDPAWPPTPPLRPEAPSRHALPSLNPSVGLSSGEHKSRLWHGLNVVDANSLHEEKNALIDSLLTSTADSRVSERSQTTPDFVSRAPDTKQDSLQAAETGRRQPVRRGTSFADKQRALMDYERVFDRASGILRRCLAADGVVFLNASVANLSQGSTATNQDESVSHLQHSRVKKQESREFDRNQMARQARRKVAETPPTSRTAQDGSDSSSSSRDRSNSDSSSTSNASPNSMRSICEILGSSCRREEPLSARVPEPTLRRLVRRHPNGKCFTLDAYGRLASSDDSSESASATYEDALNQDPKESVPVPRNRALPTKNALLKAFPGARSIVFMPLWDFAKQRWHSAVIVWSYDPGRLTNVQDDLSYLEAFNNAVMNEVNRINLALSDTAKATFLANISHELRSPLHGILGSIEFLHDTEMDDFQSSMVIAVETCGKTLLDTVNHVLDYAKINNLSNQHKSRRLGSSKNHRDEQASSSDSSLVENFDLATVVEEVVEAVYAGQVFRSAHTDVMEGKGPGRPSAGREIDMRQKQTEKIIQGSSATADHVSLTLNIGNHQNWWVNSQPGAVRRIIMNLLGNALKYTNKGSVDVALQTEPDRKRGPSQLNVLLTIKDTGRGMSEDFMKNHAFTAFTQEDSLASGTGLGLSIVRQIVDSLGGRIDLSSEKNVGTEIKVWLSFPLIKPPKGQENSHLVRVREKIQNLDICFLNPDIEGRNYNTPAQGLSKIPSVLDSMKQLVTDWFPMSVTTSPNMEGVDTNFFLFTEPPPIEYLIEHHGKPVVDREIPVIIMCTNAFEAASLRSNGIHRLTDVGRIIEIIAQPCGPQKLVKVLHRAMQRMHALYQNPKLSIAPHDVPLLTQQTPSATQTGEAPAEPYAPSRGIHPGFHHQSLDSVHCETPSSTHESRPPVPDADRERQPRSPSPQDHISNTTSTGPSSTAASSPSPAAPRVLVVDDNSINLHLLVTFVRRASHPFEPAVDGLKALEAYQRSCLEENGRHKFKYILMDISMPVMDGIEATKEIRKFEKENNLEGDAKAIIIALTGLGSQDAQEEAFQAGVDVFLSKPIRFKELQKLLR